MVVEQIANLSRLITVQGSSPCLSARIFLDGEMASRLTVNQEFGVRIPVWEQEAL